MLCDVGRGCDAGKATGGQGARIQDQVGLLNNPRGLGNASMKMALREGMLSLTDVALVLECRHLLEAMWRSWLAHLSGLRAFKHSLEMVGASALV